MTNEKRIDPLLNMETVGGGKSIAITNNLHNLKPFIGQKLGQELIDSGIPEYLHKFLNYKYVSKEEAFQLMGYRLSGWVVLYTDLDGKPYTHNGKPFYRIKPDTGQLTGYKPPKYLSAKGSGCRPYFSPLLKPQDLIKGIKGNGDLIITEGEKKTDSLVVNGLTAIGIAGVDCWRDGRSDGMLPELEAINWRGRNVFILFDSDVTSKDSVQRALKALACKLTEKGAKVRIAILPCDLDGTKNGADDFLVKYGYEALMKVLAIARESHHKSKSYNWTEEPTKSHHVAVLASIVFKNFYVLRPDIGLYKWVGTRWERIKRKPKETLMNPLHKWLNGMCWEKRENHHLGSVISQVLATIEHTEWNTPNLMSFKNGTLNVKNQSFNKTHNRKDYLTHTFDFKYDEQAKCPRWINFLNETFENNQEIIELLRAAMKWSISPKDISKPFLMELFFDLYGLKGSGKGTTLEVLKAIAGGKEAIGSLRNDFKDTVLFGLISKKVAINNDASGHMNDAGIFDSIVSNEEVPVRQLYFNQTYERLGVVVWRAFNDNPTASGGGVEGLGRRNVTFKFPKSAANPDPQLKQKLIGEVEGIFWWCWSMDDNKMFEVLKNRGNIAAVAKASIENQLENQPILQFIYDLNGEYRIQASDLYKKYQAWCIEVGKSSVSQTKFGRELNKMEGFVQKDDSSSCNYYSISETEKINLAEHFGMTNNRRLNPKSEKVASPNPQASNPPTQKEKEKSIEGLEGTPHKNSFKNKNNSKNIKKDWQTTLETLKPYTTGSAWDTSSDDEDPYWN